MKRETVLLISVLLFTLLSCSPSNRFPSLEGDYLGQEPPDETPRIFAPGIVSTGLYERDMAVSPDGNEICYGLAFGKIVTIMTTRRENGRWTEPEAASFASDLDFFYFEPCLSHDGRRILFLCTRPPEGEEPRPGWGHQNIWAADRTADGGWGEPYPLGPPVNTENSEYFPSLTRDGVLYFTRQTPETGASLYRARPSGGGFAEPERLPAAVNGKGDAYNACVSPDGSFLVACVSEPEEKAPPRPAEYRVFFHSAEDEWSEGISLGELVNPPGLTAISPAVSPDGKYFFFASARPGEGEWEAGGPLTLSRIQEYVRGPENGQPDIYWMDAEIIRRLRPKDF